MGHRHTRAAQQPRADLGQAERVGDCKGRHRSAAIRMVTGPLFSLYLKGKYSRVRDNRAAHRGHPRNGTSRNTTRFFEPFTCYNMYFMHILYINKINGIVLAQVVNQNQISFGQDTV